MGEEARRLHSVGDDDLIALVESGDFLDRAKIDQPIAEFFAALRETHPRLGGLSLSSKHMPWLAEAIAEHAPDIMLFDPAEDVVSSFSQLATHGSGQLGRLATASFSYPLAEFLVTLQRLHLDFAPTLIEL